MSTIFTRIIEGQIPGTFVYRDDVCVAFLSINPLAPGHTLVVPVEEVDEWTDLDVDTVARLFDVAHKIGIAQKRAFQCERVGLVIAGFEVNHCHVHVVPTNTMADLSFANAASSVDRDELEQQAETLRVALRQIGVKPSEN